MVDLRAARRYATALFQISLDRGLLDPVAGDLNLVADALQSNPALAAAMERPDLPAAAKKDIWTRLVKDQVQPLMLEFLEFLIDKRRPDMIAAVRDDFQKLADDYRKVARVEVTTAVPMTEDEQSKLAERLSSMVGRTVVLETSVVPAIRGGVVVRIGDKIIDGSVQGYLESLRQRLLGHGTGG